MLKKASTTVTLFVSLNSVEAGATLWALQLPQTWSGSQKSGSENQTTQDLLVHLYRGGQATAKKKEVQS